MKLTETGEKEREENKELFSKVFSKNLKLAIKNNEQFSTSKQFAEAAGMTAVSLSAYMTGNKLPTLLTAIKIADTLNVSLDDLLGRNTEFKAIPSEASLGDFARNLIAMENADVIDIKTHNGRPILDEQFVLTFRDDSLIEFFKNYKAFMEMTSGKGEREKSLYRNWLNMQLEQLDNPKVGLNKLE